MVEPLTILRAATLLSGIVEKRGSSIPILSHFRLKSRDGVLTITATDLDAEATITLPTDFEPFDVTVEAAMLVRCLSVESEHVMLVEGNSLAIKAGDVSWTLPTLPSSDFPTIKHVELATSFALPAGQLSGDMVRVSPAISTEETRYYLNGILWHLRDDALALVATDGHRLHHVRRGIPEGAATLKDSIVPRRACRLLLKAIEALEPASVQIGFGQLRARFTAGSFHLLTKLIDGHYPDYARVIPNNTRGTATVDATALHAATAAVAAVSTERMKAARFQPANGTLSAKTPEGQKCSAEIAVAIDGELPTDIGFNAGYLTTVAGLFDGQLRIAMSDATGPTAFDCPADPSFQVVLMPMRL